MAKSKKIDAANKEPAKLLHRVIHARLPENLRPACEAIARHARDLNNTAVWIASRAFECFAWDKESKRSKLKAAEDLPQDGLLVLFAFNKAIAAQNAKRTAKAKAALAAFEIEQAKADAETAAQMKPPKTAKLVPLLDKDCQKPGSIILDMTLFESVVRDWPDGLDAAARPAYSRMPSWIAKQVAQPARTSFSSWLASCKSFGEAEGFVPGQPNASQPQMPGFMAKGKLPIFAMGLTHERYAEYFPPLPAKYDMRLGEDKSTPLSRADAELFAGFGLKEFLDKALHLRHGQDSSGILVRDMRVDVEGGRPGRGVAVQIVVAREQSFPEGSFLAELARRMPDEFAENSGDGLLMTDWVKSLVSGQTWHAETMDPSHPQAWISQNFEAFGVDPGTTNLASVASSSGARALVFSGKQLEAKTQSIDAKLDKAISGFTPTRLRELDAKRSRDGSLPLNERIERKTLIKALHASSIVKKLRLSRENAIRDVMLKMAAQIKGHAVRQKVGIVFFSRNKGLKNASGKGSVFDRRSHSIPHALFAKILSETLWEAGIVLVESEESFTSKSSFADGEELPVHPAGAKQEAASKAKAARKRAAKTGKAKPESTQETKKESQPETLTITHNNAPKAEMFSATRGASGSPRNWLSRAEPNDASGPGRHRRKRVHADAQAALNAIRKCSPSFCCTSKVSLGHAIWIYVRGSWRELHTQPKHPPEKQSSFLGRTIGPPRGRNARRASKPEPTF